MELIRLNLIPTGPMPTCHASQYDKKREIGLVLFNGTRPLLLTDETLELDVRKSDSHIVTIDVPTPEGTNLAVFETTEQMCAVAGSNECELRIKKAGSDIGSLNFIMEIERSPMENGLQSDSEIRNLATQIAEAATPVVEQIAPPIIRDFLADDYYTAEQTDEAIETATEGKADTTYVNTELDKKADKTNTYTKSQVDTIANRKMNSANPTGTGSIAVGSNMLNAGSNSQTFGKNTKAFNQNTFAAGEGTTAGSNNQFVFGKYNQEDWREQYVEIVGNGTNGHSSNARTLDWQGNETIAGDLIFNGSTSLKDEIDRLDDKIDDLPEPMIFKGTLGTGGTIQTLPAADAAHEGYTYKVITEGTYAGQAAKIGDTFTCGKPEGAPDFTWVLFSQGDTDTDTWRNIKVNGTEVIGSGISSGAVDFIGSENIEIEYDSTGNKIKAKTKNLYTEAEVNELIEETVYDLLPSDTESGPISNFETDLALPLKSMEIEVKAQQEAGTPTPASPLPISGWSEISLYHRGANLFNKATVINGYYIADTDGIAKPDANSKCTDFIEVKGGATYAIMTEQTSGGWGAWYDKNKNFISAITDYAKATPTTYTAPSNAFFARLTCYRAGVGNIDTFAFNTPRTATTYEPYTGTTEVINLGGTYYGGHFTQDKDGHRQFEVTCAKEHISLQGKTYDTANGYDAWLIYLANRSLNAGSSANKLCSVCNNYKYEGSSANIEHYYIASQAVVIYLAENTFRNGEFDIVYPLATPIIIDLPDGEPISTLLGTNNIYADTGDTSVVFKDSVNGYVEKKIASVQALALNT